MHDIDAIYKARRPQYLPPANELGMSKRLRRNLETGSLTETEINEPCTQFIELYLYIYICTYIYIKLNKR